MVECRICKQHKAQEDFVKNASYTSGYATLCKKCNADRAKAFRQAQPHKWKGWKYGVTPEQIKELLESQTQCAICESKERLVIDHDHKTNKIRGILCDGCNKGLGCFKDSPYDLYSAAQYLEKHRG